MENALNKLHKAIVNDYARRCERAEYGKPEQVVEFAENLSFEYGRKYIKVVKKLGNQQMVWGFIVNGEDRVFRKGDILKAAGWSAPARNKARGNILDGDFSWVRWTGPEYL